MTVADAATGSLFIINVQTEGETCFVRFFWGGGVPTWPSCLRSSESALSVAKEQGFGLLKRFPVSARSNSKVHFPTRGATQGGATKASTLAGEHGMAKELLGCGLLGLSGLCTIDGNAHVQ